MNGVKGKNSGGGSVNTSTAGPSFKNDPYALNLKWENAQKQIKQDRKTIAEIQNTKAVA